jgi:thioredoxin-dependent peroxiredoxin
VSGAVRVLPLIPVMNPALLVIASALGGLAVGSPAPDIAARNQDGKVVKLSDFRGKPVLVYFYPKDDTPGCTREARSLSDDFSKYQALGVTILGVSRQGADSHRAFRDKYGLPFDLLVDEDGAIAKAFGVGSIPVLGLSKRQSVLVGADGRVVRFFDEVDPATHSSQVLAALSGEASKLTSH